MDESDGDSLVSARMEFYTPLFFEDPMFGLETEEVTDAEIRDEYSRS
jgi:hypothetical protein